MYNLISHLFILQSHRICSGMKESAHTVVHGRTRVFIFIFVFFHNDSTLLASCTKPVLQVFLKKLSMENARKRSCFYRRRDRFLIQNVFLLLQNLSSTAYEHLQILSDPCSSHLSFISSIIHRSYVGACNA